MDAWTLKSLRLDDEIVLRRFTPDDVDIIFETVSRNSEHLMEFMHWMVPDYSREMTEEFLRNSTAAAENRESLGFGIFRGNALIGSIGYVSFDWNAIRTEIGYWVDKVEEGKGIVSKASKLLINLAFEDLLMNRIEIRCASDNSRSAAIPIRFGFEKEGCLRQSQLRNGKLHDFLVFGLLKSEWRDDTAGKL